MAAYKSIVRITETLRDSGLSWLLPNLRQDVLVWTALGDPSFFEKVIQQKPAADALLPADFSPSRLALIAMDQSDLPGIDLQNQVSAVYDPSVNSAMRNDARQTLPPSSPHDLAAAGLTALSLLNHFNRTNSWVGLLDTLHHHSDQDWMCPLACLYGLLDDPAGLLHALLQPGSPALQHDLAVHAVFCNPLTPNEQIATLIDLYHGEYGAPLPPADRLFLLHSLSRQRPQAAMDFCSRWLELHPDSPPPKMRSSAYPAEQVNWLLENMFRAEAKRLSGKSAELPGLLDDQLSIAQNLSSRLTNNYLFQHRKLEGAKTQRIDLAKLFSTAINSANQNPLQAIDPGNQAELALVLAEQGLLEQANQLLSPLAEPLPDDPALLYANARVSFLAGDSLQSWKAASRLLELCGQTSKLSRMPVRGEGLSLVNLGNLLLDLHKFAEASTVFEQAVQICPNDENLLKMLADSYKTSHLDLQTAEALDALVALNPTNLDYHREFASSLERLGEWHASLVERLFIITSSTENSDSTPITDRYNYASCAIKANEPQSALKVCTEILDQNPEDSQALIYSGKAHLLLDQTEEGMELLSRVTQIAPAIPEAWLALAEAQKKIYPLKTVIETLTSAAQAAPESSQIRYALGDLYVQSEEPNLAIPHFQSAVELSPGNPQYLVCYGKALNSLGQSGHARMVFSQAYRLEPDYPGLAQMYSKLLLEMGEIEEAVPPLETLLNSKTVHEPEPYLDYARCIMTLCQRGSASHPPMKALIALNEVLQIAPEHAEAKALTAEALTANGENELAFQAYREALDTSLIEDKAWFERLSFGFGCVASAIGKHDIAIAALQEAGQVNPNNPAVFMALSNAYGLANLPEDSLNAARNVLALDGDDPDKLSWFTSQVAKISQDQRPEIFSSGQTFSKQLNAEALDALNKAIQLAPMRTDLLVQLGNFQSTIGERDQAQATFASLASLDFARIPDLIHAATYLSEIGDSPAVIACLEKGLAIDQLTDGEHDPALYSNLALEYVKNHEDAKALDTLDKAIELIPHHNALITQKVNILLGSGQPQQALSTIEAALQKSAVWTAKVDLLFLASRIHRSLGNFSDALSYAVQGAVAPEKSSSIVPSPQLSKPQRMLLAEIYRALLQPVYAYSVLKDDANVTRTDFDTEQDYLDFIFLHTELALQIGERINPDIQNVKLEPSHSGFSRLMALNARLLNKAGNFKQAEQLLQLAVTKNVDVVGASNLPAWSARYYQYLNQSAILEAALELGSWEQAITYAARLVEQAPDEPLSQMSLVRLHVMHAEFDHLCNVFEVVKHCHSLEIPRSESYNLCKEWLARAQSSLEGYWGGVISVEQEIDQGEIARWQTRAQIMFEENVELNLEPGSNLIHHTSPDDIAAFIHHLHQNSLHDPDNEALTDIVKLARLYPRNPSVMLRVALALQTTNPQDALKSLQSILEHNPYTKNPSTAFCNILLARLGLGLKEYEIARSAIENAISFWPDEPGWHTLAAHIYRQTNSTGQVIHHLQEAVTFAPTNSTCHLELGEALCENANDDATLLAQAVTCFETALNIDPHCITANFFLASTHFLLHDFTKAETYARNALTLAPDRADMFQLLSKLAIEKNDYQGAYEYANQAVQLNPLDVQSVVMLSKSLCAMGRHPEALAKLNAVIPVIQDARPIHLERVNIIRQTSGPQIALKELKSLVTVYPDDFSVFNALSKLLFEVGDLDDAVEVAHQALEAHPDNAPASEQASLHLLVGQALRQSGQVEQSIQHLTNAIQLAPNRLEPYLELGLARKQQREYQQALQIFERATAIAPNDPRALFQAGLALKESKDYRSSETMLRRAVSLAPNDLAIRRQLAAVVALNLIHNPRSARVSAP